MSEKKGVITQYNAVNRFGYIRPEGGGEVVGFYFNVVSNGTDGAPKTNDKVDFDAPEARKNKKGKAVQGNATAVTITERSPEPPPGSRQQNEGRVDRRAYSDPRPRRGQGRPGDRRFGGQSSGGRGPGRQGPGGHAGQGFGGQRSGGEGGRRDGQGRNDRFGGGRNGAAGGPRGERSGAPGRDGQFRPGQEGDRPSHGPRSGERRMRTGQRRAPGERPRHDRSGADAGRQRQRGRGAGGERAGRSRFPLSREFVERRADLGICNPSLLLEKFIEWPAAERRPAPDSAAAGGGWIFEERHNSYFLHHTFAQTFGKFLSHHVPWYGLKLRREAEINGLRAAGFAAATASAPAGAITGCQRMGEGFGRNHGFAIDTRYGYPVLPAWALISLLRSIIKSPEGSAAATEDERKAVLDALQHGSIAALDAFPLTNSRPVMKRVICYPSADWLSGAIKAGQLPRHDAPAAGQGEASSEEAAVEEHSPPKKRHNRRGDQNSGRPMHCLVFEPGQSWRIDFVSTGKAADSSAASPADTACRLVARALEVLSAASAQAERPAEPAAENTEAEVMPEAAPPDAAVPEAASAETAAAEAAVQTRSPRRLPSQPGVLL